MKFEISHDDKQVTFEAPIGAPGHSRAQLLGIDLLNSLDYLLKPQSRLHDMVQGLVCEYAAAHSGKFSALVAKVARDGNLEDCDTRITAPT